MFRMKHERKIMAWLMLAVMVLMAMPVSAASPSNSREMLSALEKLFTAEENLTFRGKAVLSYDGQEVHALEAERQAEGQRHFRREEYTTPEAFLFSYQDSKSEIVQYQDGARVYHFYDGVLSPFYDVVPSRTALVKLDDFGKTLVALGKAAAASLLDGKVTGGDGKLSFSLKQQDIPELMDPLLTYVIMSVYLRRGFDPDNDPAYGGPNVEYEDFAASFALYAREQLGFSEALVEAFDGEEDTTLTSDGWDKYNEASNTYHAWVRDLYSQHAGGVLYVRRDNTTQWYPSEDELLRQEGRMLLDFPDLPTMFEALFPGEQFPYKDDDVSKEEVRELRQRFIAYFREKDPNAVGARIVGDGSVVTYDTAMKYAYGSMAIAERIPLSIRHIHIKQADGSLDFDGEGRVIAMQAALEAEIQDVLGDTHSLKLSVDFTVTDYGSTKVVFPEFAPDEPEETGEDG